MGEIWVAFIPFYYYFLPSFFPRFLLKVIIEMLANVNLGEDLKVLAPGGVVAIVGSRGEVRSHHANQNKKEKRRREFDNLLFYPLLFSNLNVAIRGNGQVNINSRDLMAREASVVGVMGGTAEELAEAFAHINAGLRLR